jgi:hypothetical protein
MVFLAYFPKVGLEICDLHAVCASVNPPYWLPNAWTNLYYTCL